LKIAEITMRPSLTIWSRYRIEPLHRVLSKIAEHQFLNFMKIVSVGYGSKQAFDFGGTATRERSSKMWRDGPPGTVNQTLIIKADERALTNASEWQGRTAQGAQCSEVFSSWFAESTRTTQTRTSETDQYVGSRAAQKGPPPNGGGHNMR
jgi:hypothetical protein